jgi:hypothetical protein
MDYAPDTTDDPTFHRIAVDSQQVCDRHGLKPLKCEAFEGVNTCRRFYMFSIENISSLPMFPYLCNALVLR